VSQRPMNLRRKSYQNVTEEPMPTSDWAKERKRRAPSTFPRRSELARSARGGGPVAVAVRDRHAQQLALPEHQRERRALRLHAHEDVLAREAESRVPQHRTGEKSGLAQDVEAVADAEDGAPL